MKTVFVRVPSTLTDEEVRGLSAAIDSVLGDEYTAAIITDDIEFMSREEVREMGEALVEAAGPVEQDGPEWGIID